jgi:hypothetical protein
LTIEIILGGGVVAQRARAEDLEAQNRLLRADVARQSTQVSLRIRIDYQDWLSRLALKSAPQQRDGASAHEAALEQVRRSYGNHSHYRRSGLDETAHQ